LNSDLLRSKFLMKRCYDYTDQGHQFITMRLEVFVVYVICFPPMEREGCTLYSSERRGRRGDSTGRGRWSYVDGGGGSLKAEVLQAN
jgi:hypothetical protein